MSRAAVLIGVNRTGGLPVLDDAARGARSMERWALSQGFVPRRVLVFTDEQGPVEIGDIKRAIRALVESAAIEQLVVYFAGHGVNIRYGEYWLLSDAPVDPSAAVNVEGSIVLARRSGIPHVVFISDACRTAAEGIQAQGVTGSEIFPNDPVPGPEQAVDIFFATTLGRPALEVKDPVAASSTFRAIYTQALIDAVSGRVPAAVKPAERSGQRLHLVQPRPLKACLLDELPRRLAALDLPAIVGQVPDARITSGDEAWLAEFDSPPPLLPAQAAPPAAVPASRPDKARSARPSAGPLRAASPQGEIQWQLEALLQRGEEELADTGSRRRGRMPGARPSSPAGAAGPARDLAGGIVVTGADVADCFAASATIRRHEGHGCRLAVEPAGSATDLLLIAGDGSGVLVPVIRDFIATLVFEDGELVDLAYEPAPGAAPWQDFERRAGHLRELRRLVAGAARGGFFHPEPSTAAMLARQMRYALPQDEAPVDPALALHAAYALHDLGMTGAIRDLGRTLSRGLGIALFDVALLAGEPPQPHPQPQVHPPFPMLARGWALLSACGMTLPEELAGIQRDLLPSLWTHFNPAGASRLHELLLARRLR
jgi:hypothetical protein